MTFANVSAVLFYACVLALLFSPRFRSFAMPHLSMPGSSTKQNFAALDGFRGLAALLVALNHLWQFPRTVFDSVQVNMQFIALGSKAVPIFCVLSGFLIYRSARNVVDVQGLRRYFKRRFLRIYPIYIASTLALFVLGRNPDILPEVFMLRVFGYPTFSNPVTWSLYVEVAFYLLAPIFVFLAGRRALLLSFIAFFVLLVTDSVGGRELWLWKFFFLGIAASEIYDRIRFTEFRAFVVAMAGFALIVIDFHGRNWGHLLINTSGTYTLGLAAGVMLALSGTLQSKAISRLFSVTPLRVLGAISYSLFLMHPIYIILQFPEIDFAKIGVELQIHDKQHSWRTFFLAYLPGLLFWASLTFAFIERPFLRWKSRDRLREDMKVAAAQSPVEQQRG